MFSLMIAPLAFVWALITVEKYATTSNAMAPTVVAGDIVFGRRNALGFSRYSYKLITLPVSGRLFAAAPKRGDIVSLRPPYDPRIIWIERVVGLPGETVQMIGGVLHIDGKSVELKPSGTYVSPVSGSVMMQTETLPDGRMYSVLNFQDGSAGDDTREFRVPEGHYFLMGDNRDNSNDSRFELGFVPAENLVAVIEPPR